MPDARVLTRYVPDASFGFERGHARARARVEVWLADRRLKAEGHLEGDEIDLRVAKARLRGSTKLDAAIDAWRWEAKRLEGAQAIVHVASGSIASQDAPRQRIVDVRGLDIAVGVPEVDLDNPMKTFHATVDMPDAEIIDRRLLRGYLVRGQEIQITMSHARFSARCEIDVKDHFGSGTLDLHYDRLGFTLAELALLADVRAHARVHDWAWEHGDLAVDEANVDVANVTVTMHVGQSGQAPALAVRRIALEAKRFAFNDPLSHVELKGILAGGELTDPVALDAFLAPGSEILFDAHKNGARFDAQLVAAIDRHVAHGTVRASGRGVGFRSQKVRVRGEVEASADVEGWRLYEDKMRVKSSRVLIQRAAVDLREAKSESGVDGESPPDLHAQRIELRAKTDELDLAHPSLDRVDYRLVLDDARMDDATQLGVLLSKADAVAFAVESGRARGDADITVSRSEGKATGGVKLVLEDAGMRFHDTHLNGNFEIAANVKGFDGDTVDISGSRIAMRDVKVRGAAAETSAWSGELRLLQGAVRISETPTFDAFAQFRADNAKPFLAMMLGNSVPTFVAGLLAAEGLSGQARIALERERVAILDAHVRGDDVVAYGDYVVVGEHVRGAVVVAKGPFSAGVKVDDNGTSVRLWALESWRKREEGAVLALFAEGEARAKAQRDSKVKVPAAAKGKPVAH